MLASKSSSVSLNNRHGFVEISANIRPTNSHVELAPRRPEWGAAARTPVADVKLTESIARSTDSVSLPTMGTDRHILVSEKGFQ
jgi:hypothetical protein